MNRFLLVLPFLLLSSLTFAEHNFSICYYNQTNIPVVYVNNGIGHLWKSRGNFMGDGTLNAGESKCFDKIVDETLFRAHYTTFSIDRIWIGIVNPPFSSPYIIAQNAVAKNGGKLIDDTKNGRDNYNLHVFVTSNGIVYSNSSDINDKDSILVPRKFK